MPESQLDAIRRFIKDGEARLKNAAAENPQDKPSSSDKQAVADTTPVPPEQNQPKPAEAEAPRVQIRSKMAPRTRPAEMESPQPIQAPSSIAAAPSPGAHAATQQILFLQRRLKIVLESSHDAIISVDGNRKWTPANRRLLEWLGYDEEELLKVDFNNLFQQEVAATLLDSFPGWLEGEVPLRHVPGNLRGKGEVQIPVLISSHAGVNELSEPFAYLMFEDTRPQRNLQLKLERGRALVNTILQEGTIPTLVIGKDGVIEEANRAASDQLGIRRDEISGMRLRDFVRPASLEEFNGSFDRALRAQYPAEALGTFFRKDSSQFRGRIIFAGVPDTNGAVERVIGMLDQIVAEPTSAWTAYGLMTPGVLSELSGFMARHIRVVLEQVRTKAKPDVKRLVKGINGVRSVISRWMESATLIPEFPAPCAFADLVRQAIDLRTAEFSKWGITAQFENIPAANEVCDWPPAIFHALLHIIQWCIENLREDPGNRRLVIWFQKTDDHLEVSFICRCAESADSTNPMDTGNDSDESLSFKRLELKLARKLMDSLGATLVLENISKVHQVIRISVNPSQSSID
jgi:PAS domain S-box-containing protein